MLKYNFSESPLENENEKYLQSDSTMHILSFLDVGSKDGFVAFSRAPRSTKCLNSSYRALHFSVATRTFESLKIKYKLLVTKNTYIRK